MICKLMRSHRSGTGAKKGFNAPAQLNRPVRPACIVRIVQTRQRRLVARLDASAGGLAVADAAAALLPFLSGQVGSQLSQQLGSGLLNITSTTNLPQLLLQMNNSVTIPAAVSPAPAHFLKLNLTVILPLIECFEKSPERLQLSDCMCPFCTCLRSESHHLLTEEGVLLLHTNVARMQDALK